MTMEKIKPTLDERRRELNPFQKELLQEIWRYFQANGEWPILRELFSKHGTHKVKKALSPLGGGVGREERGSTRWSKFQLFLLGILLTEDGPALQKLLARFFKFQQKLFLKEPRKEHSTAAEIASALELKPEETADLGRLLWLGQFGGSQDKENNAWTVSAMQEAETFPKNGDLSAQVEEWVLRFIYRDAPVFVEDQHTAQLSTVMPTYAGLAAVATEPHPPEIAVSLERLRKKYPDQTKLGFLVMRFADGKPFDQIVEVIKRTADKHGIVVVRADENHFHSDLLGNVRTLMHGCSFGIAVYERIQTNEPNANVGLEVGYLMAMNKPVLLLKDKTVVALQSDLAGKLYQPFDPHDPEKTIPDQLTNWLADKGIIVPKRI
jgi:hypothetical protein